MRNRLARDACEAIFMETIMIYWAAVFLIIALVAAVLGFTGIAGTAVNIAWILFVVGLIVAVIFFALGRRSPPL